MLAGKLTAKLSVWSSNFQRRIPAIPPRERDVRHARADNHQSSNDSKLISQTARTDRCIYPYCAESGRAWWSGGSSYESLDTNSCKNAELRDSIYRQTVGRYWRLSRNTKPLPAKGIDRIFLPQISCSYSELSTVIARINITMPDFSLSLSIVNPGIRLR